MSCFDQALLTLARFRKNETFAQACDGSGVSEATAGRDANETLEVLAAWAPGLHEALVGLGEGDFVIVDGTLIATDRIKADEPYYSQKHRKDGIIQAGLTRQTLVLADRAYRGAGATVPLLPPPRTARALPGLRP